MPSLAKTKVQPKKGLQVKRKLNKKFIILITIVIAAIGAYLLFFASAATNNCQAENGVQICDVDQAAGGADTVLSTGGEAESLGAQGWGTYYGAAFRAPTTAYNGAVPIHRVFNAGATYHDFVTDAQKGQKEAKYGANNYEGIAFFAWTTQQPNTVPVYRISRGGSATQAMFSTDRSWVDNMLAQGANNPDGWKVNQYGDEIAFYAYPPNYKVADAVNPYDCSIQENFISSRCDAARNNLVSKINNGAPVGSTCPESLDVYLKAPFVSQFDAACQKKWNDYMQRCDVPENFNTDRCKGPREALAAAQKAQIEARKKAEAEAAAAAAKANPTKYPTQKDPKTPPTANAPAPNGIPAQKCQVPGWVFNGTQCTPPTTSGPTAQVNPTPQAPAATNSVFECAIEWKQERTWPFSNDSKMSVSKRSFGVADYASAKTWCKNVTASFLATRTTTYMGNVVDPNPKSNCNGGLSKDPCRMYDIGSGLTRYGDKTKGFSFYFQNVYEKKHYIY